MIASYRQDHGQSRFAWSEGASHLALFCIHQMNQVNFRNDFVTINTGTVLSIIIIIIIIFAHQHKACGRKY